MAAIDAINRIYREFQRYTGDGKPGEPTNAPLPIGDPSSSAHSPNKAELRAAFVEAFAEVDAAVDQAALYAGMAQNAAIPDASITPQKISGWGGQPQGRLSLLSGSTVSAADIVGATSVYYVPASGRYVPVFNGSVILARDIGAQLVLPLDADSSHTNFHAVGLNYDAFVFADGATTRLGSTYWNIGGGSDTARGTGAASCELELFNGMLVNKNEVILRFGVGALDLVTVPARRATYVGSFRPTANGQVSDAASRRLVFNAFNQLLRPMRAFDPTATWTYSTAAYRQAKANTGNQLEFLLGLAGISVEARASSLASYSDPTGVNAQVAIGLDSTTAPAADSLTGWVNTASIANQATAFYSGSPGLGRHTLTWLERGPGTGTMTWFGTSGDGIVRQGIIGGVLA